MDRKDRSGLAELGLGRDRFLPWGAAFFCLALSSVLAWERPEYASLGRGCQPGPWSRVICTERAVHRRTRSTGPSSSWSPRRPAETKTVLLSNADASMTTGRWRREPIGLIRRPRSRSPLRLRGLAGRSVATAAVASRFRSSPDRPGRRPGRARRRPMRQRLRTRPGRAQGRRGLDSVVRAVVAGSAVPLRRRTGD